MVDGYTVSDQEDTSLDVEPHVPYIGVWRVKHPPSSGVYYLVRKASSLPVGSLRATTMRCKDDSDKHVEGTLRKRFDALANTWKKQTGHISNINTRCTHPAYQQIVGMGRPAIAFILRDLKQTHDDWFWALSAITGENPIPRRHAGYVNKMTEAWLRWAKVRGYDV